MGGVEPVRPGVSRPRRGDRLDEARPGQPVQRVGRALRADPARLRDVPRPQVHAPLEEHLAQRPQCRHADEHLVERPPPARVGPQADPSNLRHLSSLPESNSGIAHGTCLLSPAGRSSIALRIGGRHVPPHRDPLQIERKALPEDEAPGHRHRADNGPLRPDLADSIPTPLHDSKGTARCESQIKWRRELRMGSGGSDPDPRSGWPRTSRIDTVKGR